MRAVKDNYYIYPTFHIYNMLQFAGGKLNKKSRCYMGKVRCDIERIQFTLYGNDISYILVRNIVYIREMLNQNMPLLDF